MSDTFTQSSRTPEDEFLGRSQSTDFNSVYYDQFLNHLFSFGAIKDKTFEIFPELNITLRVLLPAENIEVAKALDDVGNIIAKEIVLKVETLARAITKVNGQLLRFPDENVKEWQEFRNSKENPSDIEQQRFYLKYKFKPQLINIIYEKYNELLKEQEEKFIELKKK